MVLISPTKKRGMKGIKDKIRQRGREEEYLEGRSSFEL